MPGKVSQAGNRKGHESRDRICSANTNSESGSKKITIWPEWNEAELSLEKWDVSGTGGGGAGKGPKKSIHPAAVYDDPDGVVLPLSLADPNTVVWKRLSDETLSEKISPVIVNNPETTQLDLYSSNKHLLHSQLICWIIGQLNALWHMRHSLSVEIVGGNVAEKEGSLAWRPWEHIQPHAKGSPAPQINLAGKYCVRLFWMGCWRKVTIDDKLPFLEKSIPARLSTPNAAIERPSSKEKREIKREGSGRDRMDHTPLYIRTAIPSELWPALLMKAILKVVSLDYTEGSPEDEFGDSSVIHMLTGWTPYSIPLKPYSQDLWETLCKFLPIWKRPESGEEEAEEGEGMEREKSVTEARSCVEIPPRSQYIIMGSFTSQRPGCLSAQCQNSSSLQDISKTENLLKKFEIIPEEYSLQTLPSFPVLLTQIRDQLLVPPPKEPPLPELQAPYYLGLKHRKRPPGLPTPPPTPPPVEPRFIELIPTLRGYCEIINTPTSSEIAESPVVSAQTSVAVMEEESKQKLVEKPSRTVEAISSKPLLSVSKPPNEKSSKKKTTQSSEIIEVNYLKVNLKWMNFLEFIAAFQKILVFTNPTHYKHRDIFCDLSKTVGAVPVGIAPRAATASSSKKGVSSTHLTSSSRLTSLSNDHNCLFIDSVSPVELLFVFSSLSNWREGGKDTHRCNISGPPAQRPSRGFSPYRPAIAISVLSDHHHSTPPSTPDTLQQTDENASLIEGDSRSLHSGVKRGGVGKILSGNLVVETYSWRSARFGDPVLQLSTTGVKGAIFSLPAGRHVFKLHVRVPIGHHLEIFSHSPFLLTSEDGIFMYLSQDCSRFVECSNSIAESLHSNCRKHSCSTEVLSEGVKSLTDMLSKYGLTAGQAKLLLSSALHSLLIHAKDFELTGKMQTAWKSFLFRLVGIFEEQLPQTAHPIHADMAKLRNQLKAYSRKAIEPVAEPEVPEMWKDRLATSEEEDASRVISTKLRAYTKARLEDSMIPGTQANREAAEALEQSQSILQPHLDTLGITMLYGLFKLDPSLVDKFPFGEDMKSQTHSTVYCGSFPYIESNSWTIVLRRTFHVTEPQLIAFHFHCPLPTNILRVIDNDTMEEMPRVFESTMPRTYHPNGKGYTLQAEAWVIGVAGMAAEEALEDKKWKLRISSSCRDAPPQLEGISSEEQMIAIHDTFHKQELMNYCLPDREEILFRFLLTTTQRCPVSLQVTSSKPDALIKFEILDYKRSLVAVEAHGVCTIPLFFLERSGNEGDSTHDTTKTTEQEMPAHKYVVQARILRKSWPLAETAWPHIAFLLPPSSEERPGSSHKPNSGSKKSKGAKDRRKTAASVQITTPAVATPQPQIDTSKPHWLLRVVVTKDQEECLEVKKDTERADQLKSMVQAWEAEQPGRCKRAQESRQKFLDMRAIREEKPNEDDNNSTSTLEGGGRLSPHPQPNTGPVKIWQMDLTPFIIKESETQILLDEKEKALRLEERQRLFKEYRSSRQTMLDLRNEDRQRRNEAKVKQIEMAEQRQAELEKIRKELNHAREVLRDKRLAKERAEAEKLKALEEIQSAAAGGRDSKAKGKKKKK